MVCCLCQWNTDIPLFNGILITNIRNNGGVKCVAYIANEHRIPRFTRILITKIKLNCGVRRVAYINGLQVFLALRGFSLQILDITAVKMCCLYNNGAQNSSLY
jgi:hypothetical protein